MTAIANEPAGGRAGWLVRYRSALSRGDVRRLFGGLVISGVGTWAYNTALIAFVFERTHSLGWVGAAGLARFIPSLVLSAYAGVIAERVERVSLMVRSDVLSAAFQAALAIVAAADGPPALGLVLAVFTAASTIVYPSATAAMIPALVPEDDLAAANALNGTIEQLIVIAGPAIGAVLLLVASPALVFALNAATFVISAVLVGGIRVRSQPVDVTEAGSAGPLRQMLVGARTIIHAPAARTLVAYSVLVSFLYGTDTVLFIGVSAHRLGTGTQGFGYLLAGLGLGGILIAGAVDRLAASRRLATIILAGTLGYCLPTALLTVIHSPGLAFAVEVVRGACTLVVDVLAVTALQRAVAPDLLARVFGVFFAFILSGIALGTVLTPVIVNAFGLNAGLWIMALGPVPVALAGYPALLAIDRATVARAAELEPRVRLLESLGLFAAASRPVLERLAGAAETVTFAPATTIVREGDPADAIFAMAQGSARVTSYGESGGPERELRVMSAPAFFGEIGVLEGIPRTATVTAVEACTCERIDGETFLEALTTSPPSTSLMETARSRLAVNHPSRRIAFAAESAGD